MILYNIVVRFSCAHKMRYALRFAFCLFSFFVYVELRSNDLWPFAIVNNILESMNSKKQTHQVLKGLIQNR